MSEETKDMATEIADLRGKNAELESLFDLQYEAFNHARKRWQAAHPGQERIFPDLAALLSWVMDEADKERGSVPTKPTKDVASFEDLKTLLLWHPKACKALGVRISRIAKRVSIADRFQYVYVAEDSDPASLDTFLFWLLGAAQSRADMQSVDGEGSIEVRPFCVRGGIAESWTAIVRGVALDAVPSRLHALLAAIEEVSG